MDSREFEMLFTLFIWSLKLSGHIALQSQMTDESAKRASFLAAQQKRQYEREPVYVREEDTVHVVY